MGLNEIASRMDQALEQAEQVAEERSAQLVESDAKKMAHHIVAYVLEQADVGQSPFELGATMVQGATIGEAESGGFLAEPVVEFLEALLAGAKASLSEQAEEDPVARAVDFYRAHHRFPESASPVVQAKARALI